MASDSKLMHRIAWRFLLDAFSRGTFFVIAIIVGRTLSVGDFGKYGYALSLVFFVATFIDMGTHLQLMKELGAERGKNESLWGDFWNLKLGLIAVFSLIFIPVAPFVWKWDHFWVLYLALVWMYGNSFNDFLQIVCNATGRMRLARNSLLVQRGAVLIGTLLALLLNSKLEILFVGMSTGAIIGTFFSTQMIMTGTKCPFKFKWEWHKWKDMLRNSLPNALTVTFATWYLRLGAIVLAWYWSSKDVGEYSAAFRIFEITYISASAVMNIGAPHLAEMYYQQRSRFKPQILKILTLMVGAGCLWGFILYVASPHLIVILFGERYSQAIPILKIFALTSVVLFVNFVSTHLLIVINQQKRLALFEGFAFFVGLVLYFVLIPSRSGLGAACSLLGIELIILSLTGTFLVFHFLNRRRKIEAYE